MYDMNYFGNLQFFLIRNGLGSLFQISLTLPSY